MKLCTNLLPSSLSGGRVLPVDGEVAAGVVRALHPDLAQVGVAALWIDTKKSIFFTYTNLTFKK